MALSWTDEWIKFNLMGRIMCAVSTFMAWRCAEWFMLLPEPTTQQSAFVSVIMGVYTGIFGIFMGAESKR